MDSRWDVVNRERPVPSRVRRVFPIIQRNFGRYIEGCLINSLQTSFQRRCWHFGGQTTITENKETCTLETGREAKRQTTATLRVLRIVIPSELTNYSIAPELGIFA
jgi:hypothetical protein